MSGKKRYPVRIPRFATGIRAQETRAGVGRSWWAHRWKEVLEGMGLGGRLGRGRNYAVGGQVMEMVLEGSQVVAKVQGTRQDPYEVRIDFRQPDSAALNRIRTRLRKEPMLVARLLVDDLPMEIEALFRNEGFDFFPGGKLAPGKYDVTMSCSCPDYANPCKHTSAVLLLLGEEIARRPATLLALRGIDMGEVCDED